jgi:hypothetical protein
MASLNQYVKQNQSVSESDDSRSTSNASSVSASLCTQKCPSCKKEFQARYMFNHLRKFHPDTVKSMYGVWKPDDMDELIKTNAPFPIDWEETDDFDETINKTLWGCLGCNNTFTTEYKAVKHCNDKKCKKEHNAQLRRIKKEEQQDKEKEQKKLSESRMRWLNRTPEQIFECIKIDVTYYDNKFNEVGAKVARYLCAMKRDDSQNYIYFSTMNPVFEDDKKKMEALENQIHREIMKWERMYKDILPALYAETSLISHDAYYALERRINWTNDCPRHDY